MGNLALMKNLNTCFVHLDIAYRLVLCWFFPKCYRLTTKKSRKLCTKFPHAEGTCRARAAKARTLFRDGYLHSPSSTRILIPFYCHWNILSILPSGIKKIPFCTSPRFSVTPCLCTHLHLRVCLVSHTLSESHLRAAIIGAEAIWGLYLSALNFRALNFLLSNQKY